MQLDKPGTEKIRKARDDREKHHGLQVEIAARARYRNAFKRYRKRE